MDPVDRTRWLRSEDFDLRPQKDREMGFCEFNQIRRRYHIVCMTDVPLPIDEKNSFIPSNII
jgi:hypothetical protein